MFRQMTVTTGEDSSLSFQRTSSFGVAFLVVLVINWFNSVVCLKGPKTWR